MIHETPFISYLVTCKNDGKSIWPLLNLLNFTKDNFSCECVILDDFSDDQETLSILDEVNFNRKGFFKVSKHHLDNHYSNHKNYGKSLCSGKWIFQIDSDELPAETLLLNLKDIIETNPMVELFWVPRINDFRGVNQENARQWGWRLTQYEDRFIVNWPDPQTRIFLNTPRIKWERPLHEKVEGAMISTHLPHEYEFSLHHNKTIQKQIETNIRYNRDFSEELNRGHILK